MIIAAIYKYSYIDMNEALQDGGGRYQLLVEGKY